ncbi:hypothetical protein [Psychrobium sp. 1_MG-2023]|uniref:hypothetical protein n=1 Tax=Psychrobium sp. 1_MG-2023 TaxID=3062624 RepID=UPI000C345321|nr:hypothetical protein [Psychrobium sp. 1_MG-2023]MDP2561197.1 hypothetical protein [Psychrobium sp. 1_MG-2023]PKF55297.1 hypothetical protein CW748_13860 [Alteromonadales bacterium alter-6D02]
MIKRVGSLLFMTLLSFNSLADWKINNGSLCGTQLASDENKVARANGEIKNISSSSVYVFCPVVKDKTSEQKLNHVTLYTSFLATAKCAGGTLDTSGKSIQHFTTSDVQPGSNIVTSISRDTDSNDDDSSYYVTCHLTPGSALNYYMTAE